MKQNWLNLGLLFVCCLVVALFVRLGFWQLSRAQEKLAIKSSVAVKSALMIDLAEQSVSFEDRFIGAQAQGRYLRDKTLLLDRQLLNGVPAYSVITPFEITNTNQVVLVNRGLIAATNDRGVLPEIVTPSQELNIFGNLNYPTQKPEFWRDSFPIEKNTVWQYLDMSLIQEQLGRSVTPLVLELNKDIDLVGGYIRQWRSYDDQWVNRHRAYALQWFSMAFVFVVMCFFAFRSRNK